MVMTKAVDELARKTPGKKSYAIDAYSRTLLAIHTTIDDNGGLDNTELIAQLCVEHQKEERNARIDIITGSVGERFGKDGHPIPIIPDFVHSMKNMCKLKRPEVETDILVAEGKEKGPAVAEEAKKKEVAMLILGQKKRSMSWRLLMMWAGNRRIGSNGVVEHCIQNASCMAIAVRRSMEIESFS